MIYEQLVSRNSGYISQDLQSTIRSTRLLIAGCGLGSVFAETAVRTGFESFVLLDGDTVSAHNLNRQIYVDSDIDQFKTGSLAKRLKAINPNAVIDVRNEWLKPETADRLVADCDLIIDTIDFLDLPAVIALHDAARAANKPILSAFSAGWGAVVGVFLPTSVTLRTVFGLPETGSLNGATYPIVFAQAFKRLFPQLPADFVSVTSDVLQKMAEGRPCPAPQLASGANCAAAAICALAVRLLDGQPVAVAPDLILVDLADICTKAGIRTV